MSITSSAHHPWRRARAAARSAAAAAVAVAVVATLFSAPPASAADEALTIDFATSGSAPEQLASGTIYGMTEDGSLPQDHFFTDIKWNYMRAGGAQLDNPGGWVGGTYPRRWAATKAQAIRTERLGGEFVLLVHDLWGADAETREKRFPGDNGDWTAYDAFLNQLISDVRASGLDVQWDLWNEPDLGLFWDRPQSQYLAMWKRGYDRVRAAIPGAIVVGPSATRPPANNNAWWTTYLDFAKANAALPDIYSWHVLPADPVATSQAADALLAARGITRTTRYQINEYGWVNEQTPADGAWYIARLERAGAVGLRANWGLGSALNDYLAKLLVKSGAQYLPTGEWWTYRYYAAQTGTIVSSTASPAYDAFATKAPGRASVLLGGGGTTGNMAITLSNLNATTGIVSNNQARVVVERIPYNNGGAVAGPEVVSNTVVTLSGGSTTVNIPRTNNDDGFTITVLPTADTSFSGAVVARHSGQCLDDTNLSLADGTQQQQYLCEGGAQQQWRFLEVAGSANTYTIVNQLSGKCLEVSGASVADGAAVVQRTCAGTTNQQFILRKVTASGASEKDFQLVARHSNKCVDVSGVSTAPRALIHQWTCNSTSQATPANQTWRLLGR